MLPANRANIKRTSSRSRKRLRLLTQRWIRAIGCCGAGWTDWLGTELMVGSKQSNKEERSSTNLCGEFVQKNKTSPLITLMSLIYTDKNEKLPRINADDR